MKYQSAITSLAAVVLASSATLETVSSFVPTASTGSAPSISLQSRQSYGTSTTDQLQLQHNTQLSVASSEIVDEDEADVKPRKTREVRKVHFVFLFVERYDACHVVSFLVVLCHFIIYAIVNSLSLYIYIYCIYIYLMVTPRLTLFFISFRLLSSLPLNLRCN